jgi:hypothetical protein
MVISGGTFSIAFCISSAAFANLFVSMFIPTLHAGQRMCSLDFRAPIDCSSSCPHCGHWNLITYASTLVIVTIQILVIIFRDVKSDGFPLHDRARLPARTYGRLASLAIGGKSHKINRIRSITNKLKLSNGPSLKGKDPSQIRAIKHTS